MAAKPKDIRMAMKTKVGLPSIKSHLQKARTAMLIDRGGNGAAPGGAASVGAAKAGDIHSQLAGAIRELRHFRS